MKKILLSAILSALTLPAMAQGITSSIVGNPFSFCEAPRPSCKGCPLEHEWDRICHNRIQELPQVAKNAQEVNKQAASLGLTAGVPQNAQALLDGNKGQQQAPQVVAQAPAKPQPEYITPKSQTSVVYENGVAKNLVKTTNIGSVPYTNSNGTKSYRAVDQGTTYSVNGTMVDENYANSLPTSNNSGAMGGSGSQTNTLDLLK